MALQNLFKTLKQPKGLATQIDQYLILMGEKEADNDRKNITNSPSSALGCVRANYYQRQGIEREPIEPRVRRIFDNGHGVHERLQKYLTDMGVLYMDEVPLVHEKDEIQGHTDGIMSMKKVKTEIEILEIKSINGRQFPKLSEPKPEHRAQAQVYIYVAEEHRKMLKESYPTHKEFKQSELSRRKKYRKRYLHLIDGAKYTQAEKINHKVKQHITMDNILYNVVKPISKAVVLYECKDTQEMKDYEITMDGAVMEEVLEKFRLANFYWKEQKTPPRECRNKSDGRWCNYVNHCFGV
jgi:hypothetical protein